MEELGYESSNFVGNTQTISFILMLLTLACIILATIKFFNNCCQCCNGPWAQRISTYLSERLFFADVLTLTRESYIEFLIAGFMTWRNPLY
jgi:hypothetical protein